MPGVSSGRVGMWPSAWPEAEQGQGGLLIGTQRACVSSSCYREGAHDGTEECVTVYGRRNRMGGKDSVRDPKTWRPDFTSPSLLLCSVTWGVNGPLRQSGSEKASSFWAMVSLCQALTFFFLLNPGFLHARQVLYH